MILINFIIDYPLYCQKRKGTAFELSQNMDFTLNRLYEMYFVQFSKYPR